MWAAEPGAPTAEPDAPALDAAVRVDLNSASVVDLQRLPGIGPVAAQRIVDERSAGGPFRSVEDLVRVPGIGPARVRVLAEHLRV